MNPLQKSRRERGLSQRALAHLSGLPFRTIQLLEKGGHDPRFSTVQKLAVALGAPASALERRLLSLFSSPPDSVIFTSERVVEDGEASWKIWLFDFVDAFRESRSKALIEDPPIRDTPLKILSLLTSVVESLCDEAGMEIPAWCDPVPLLSRPWFVSGTENLKAMALVESPVHFRKRNIFVLGNFLGRA